MPSTVALPPSTSCDRRAGWSGPLRWQREVQLAASLAEPKCAFRRHSLARLSDSVQETLATLIEQVAIPTLFKRYRSLSRRESLPHEAAPGSTDRLMRHLLAPDGYAAAAAMMNDLARAGVPPDTLLLDVMCEAEALLDQRVDQARCTPLEALASVCQLRTLALAFSRGAQHEHTRSPGTACILATPGDTLRFAPVLHECYLRMAGWSVEKLEGLPAASVRNRLWSSSPELVVCVLNDSHLLARATDLIARLRVGREPGVGPLFVGVGAGFSVRERWPSQVALDAVAGEPGETLELAAGGGCCSGGSH